MYAHLLADQVHMPRRAMDLLSKRLEAESERNAYGNNAQATKTLDVKIKEIEDSIMSLLEETNPNASNSDKKVTYEFFFDKDDPLRKKK